MTDETETDLDWMETRVSFGFVLLTNLTDISIIKTGLASMLKNLPKTRVGVQMVSPGRLQLRIDPLRNGSMIDKSISDGEKEEQTTT